MSIKYTYTCDVCKQDFHPSKMIEGPLEICIKRENSGSIVNYVVLTKSEHVCQEDYGKLFKDSLREISSGIRNKINAIQS